MFPSAASNYGFSPPYAHRVPPPPFSFPFLRHTPGFDPSYIYHQFNSPSPIQRDSKDTFEIYRNYFNVIPGVAHNPTTGCVILPRDYVPPKKAWERTAESHLKSLPESERRTEKEKWIKTTQDFCYRLNGLANCIRENVYLQILNDSGYTFNGHYLESWDEVMKLYISRPTMTRTLHHLLYVCTEIDEDRLEADIMNFIGMEYPQNEPGSQHGFVRRNMISSRYEKFVRTTQDVAKQQHGIDFKSILSSDVPFEVSRDDIRRHLVTPSTHSQLSLGNFPNGKFSISK